MPGHVVLEPGEHSFAQRPLEYRCSPRHLAVTELMCASTWSAALAAPASAPTMELINDVLTVAHGTYRFADGLAVLRLLPKLALVGSDACHSTVLQNLGQARLAPRSRIRRNSLPAAI